MALQLVDKPEQESPHLPLRCAQRASPASYTQFVQARGFGLEVGDSEAEQVKFWAEEFSRSHAYWKNRY